MIIDFHTHVFSPHIVSNREKFVSLDALFKTLYSENKAQLATTENLISNMDIQEIQKSVLLNIAWNSQELCCQTNDYIIESIVRYPNRLIGFCMVDFESPDTAILEIERCHKFGIKGVGEIRLSKGLLKQHSLLQPIIDSIINHNLVLLIHTSEPVGHYYPGKGEITPELLYPFITHNPDLKLVCAHWGGGLPFYSLMPKVKPHYRNLFFDSAASPLLYSSQVYSQVAQLVGLDKILFGSDYPLLSPRRLINEIDTLEISSEAKKAILSVNANKLLEISSE